MWSFGVGLFLISLSPNSLQLPAVYGFSSGGATLLFAGLVGYWVDNTPRLTGKNKTQVKQVIHVPKYTGRNKRQVRTIHR